MTPAAPAAQRAYQLQLAHVANCARCRMQVPCTAGRLIRRALQEARSAAPSMNSRRVNGGL